MLQTQASIIQARRVGPGMSILTLRAPDIASRARAGQLVLVRCSDADDPYLRRAFPLFAITPPDIALLVRADEPGRRWLAHQATGTIDLLGPVGRGFTLSPLTRNLLLVSEGLAIACLAALARVATAAGIAVTLAAGAPSATTTLPADLLPTDVEYLVATADGSLGQRGTVASLLPDVVQWADQIGAAGSPALYRALSEVIARHRLIVDDDFAQVWWLGPIACGLGTCLSCTVETRHGRVLSCREGPVFRLRDLDLTAIEMDHYGEVNRA